MEVLKDELASHKEMAIVERFGVFVDYSYPIAINIRRTHHVVRDMLIASMFEQANLFAQAGKSSQVSRLYAADAGLAHLRFQLRFLADEKRRLISRHQHEVASVHLAEVGRMLGSWIRAKTLRCSANVFLPPGRATLAGPIRTTFSTASE